MNNIKTILSLHYCDIPIWVQAVMDIVLLIGLVYLLWSAIHAYKIAKNDKSKAKNE